MTHSRLALSVTLGAALALAPSAAHAARMTASSSAPALGPRVGEIDYSGIISLEFPPSGLDVGPRLTAEGMYGFMDVAPQARLSLGGRAAFAYHSGSGFDGSQWLLEAVPDAKLTYAVTPLLGVYGDLGLGLALLHTSVNVPAVPAIGFPGASASDTTLALTFQIGAGAKYAVTPNVNVLGEVRFDFYTKSGYGTFIAFPGIGLEWHG